MEISHRQLPRVDILALSGRVQAPEASQIQARINELFAERRYRILLDLEQLDYISSGGLRVLMQARKAAQEHRMPDGTRGDVRVVNLPPRLKNVFDLVGFTKIFEIYDDMVDAVGSF
jgi:anti-sigma B factor antagonist